MNALQDDFSIDHLIHPPMVNTQRSLRKRESIKPQATVVFCIDEIGPMVKDYMVTPRFSLQSRNELENYFLKLGVNCISMFGFGQEYEECVVQLPAFGIPGYKIILVSIYNGACLRSNEIGHIDYFQICFFFKTEDLYEAPQADQLEDPILTMCRHNFSCIRTMTRKEFRDMQDLILDIINGFN